MDLDDEICLDGVLRVLHRLCDGVCAVQIVFLFEVVVQRYLWHAFHFHSIQHITVSDFNYQKHGCHIKGSP